MAYTSRHVKCTIFNSVLYTPVLYIRSIKISGHWKLGSTWMTDTSPLYRPCIEPWIRPRLYWRPKDTRYTLLFLAFLTLLPVTDMSDLEKDIVTVHVVWCDILLNECRFIIMNLVLKSWNLMKLTEHLYVHEFIIYYTDYVKWEKYNLNYIWHLLRKNKHPFWRKSKRFILQKDYLNESSIMIFTNQYSRHCKDFVSWKHKASPLNFRVNWFFS